MVDLAEIQTIYYMVAATGVLVAAIYYILNMRATQRNLKANLETRQAQLFMNIAYQSFNNLEWQKAWRTLHRHRWSSAKEFIELMKWPEESEFGNAWLTISGFYEGLGVFVKEKLIDIRMVALLMTSYTKPFFEMNAPFLKELREYYKMPRLLSETEYLYNELITYLEKHPEIKT